MAKKSRLTPGQKVEVVLKLLRREDSAARLARRYGISEQTLYRYRDQFLEAGKAGFNGKRDLEAQIKELKRAVEKREQVIGELTIANRILKKFRKASFDRKSTQRSGG